MKISYAVRNLRRLRDLPLVQIRPITILLGRNSAGKSTFLRSFPLLRQSLETRSSAPILWYGDYVDFGDFESAVTNRDSSKEIDFLFEIERNEDEQIHRVKGGTYQTSNPHRTYKAPRETEIRYRVSQVEKKTQLREILIRVPQLKSELSLLFDPDSPFCAEIISNGISIKRKNAPIKNTTENFEFYFLPGQIFYPPTVLVKSKLSKEEKTLLGTTHTSAIESALIFSLSKIVGNKVKRPRIEKEARRMLRHNSLDDDSLEQLSKADTATFRKMYESMMGGGNHKQLSELNALIEAAYLFSILDDTSDFLASFFNSVDYINPARAKSERYYRQQELEVTDISPDGSNLPIFLASLEMEDLEEFSNWVESFFGYGISIHKTSGHISINMTQNGSEINVADTGYGVSQVLPVLAQTWWMNSRTRETRHIFSRQRGLRQTLAIEQPELHLHPAHQAILADIFVEARQQSKSRGRSETFFLIETHSETLINRLGELVDDGKINKDDIQIVIFGNESDADGDIISISSFDEDGILTNWPFGFFNFTKL